MTEQRRVADRALGLERLIPGDELTGGIGLARVIDIAARRLLLDYLSAADRAGRTSVLGQRLGVGALGEARAGQELTEASGLDDHLTSALLADYVGFLVRDLDARLIQVLLGLFERAGEPVIEGVQQLHIGDLTGFDLVELVFHVGRKLIVCDRLELINQQTGHALAQRGRTQAAVFLADVVAVDDGSDGRRVGGRTANALFFHRADERCLGVACGGLGEVLGRVDLIRRQGIALAECGQRFARLGLFCLFALLVIVVRALLVDRGKAREGDGVAGSAEDMSLTRNIGRDGIQNGISHLAGNKARPDELIELVLVGGELIAHRIGFDVHVGRADGFVRILCRTLGLEHARLARVALCAVALLNVCGSSCGGLIGQAQRVGTHVGDQTGQAVFTAQLDAFVQFLRHAHGTSGHHIELARCFLLQGGRGERGGCRLFLLALLDRRHDEGLTGDLVHDLAGLFLGLELDLAVRLSVITRGESTARLGAQNSLNRPVFLGLECSDFLLTVDDQAGCYRLDTSGRQAALDLAPQKGRQAIADDAVQDTARLLRVYQVDVDVARMLNTVAHALLGDLIEGHALVFALLEVQKGLQMPGDRFSLAVRVGCEVDKIGFLGCLAQLGDDLILSLDRPVFRLKIVLEIHAHGLSRQVTQMSHRGFDDVVAAQILANGLGLGWGLHDYQFRHSIPPLMCSI